MNSDCVFAIGKTHRVCQDYAVAGTQANSAYVLLADGCSGSPDTDIGARLLVKSAEQDLAARPLHDGSDWEAYHDNAVRRAAVCAETLGLAPTCLDATLLTVHATHDAFTATCYGDGMVALGRRDGRLEILASSYGANYPRYAAYTLDASRQAQWETQPGNEKRIQRWLSGPNGVEQEECRLSVKPFETWTGDCADYHFVAVLSDGTQSFAQTRQTDTSCTTQPVPVTDVLAALLAFKGHQGQFVQRRAQAFFRECQTRQWHHHDDLSLAVIWLGD